MKHNEWLKGNDVMIYSLRMEKEMHEKIKNIAEKEKRTIGQQILYMADTYFKSAPTQKRKEDVECQITQVQIMAEYAMHIFEFATRNRYAKKEVDDFFKEPNSKNMFCLLQDLFLPMAAGMLFHEKEYIETLEEFPNVKENIKHHIKQAEKIREWNKRND